METCPNCGAVARPGAKFCTTCGTRLGGIATVSPTLASEMSAPSPAGTTATTTWSWGTPAAAPDPEPARPEQTATADDSADAASDWDWPAPFSAPSPSEARDDAAGPGDVDTSSALVDTPIAEPAEQPAAATDSATEDDAADALSSWAARWNAETGSWKETNESTSDEDSDEDVESPSSQTESPAGIEGAPAGLDGTDEPEADEIPALPDMGTIEQPAEAPDDPAFAGIEGAPAGAPEALVVAGAIADEAEPTPDSSAEPDAATPIAAPAVAPADADTDAGVGAQARAASLLDELRSLLPQLATAGSETAGINPEAVLAPLQGVRGERAAYDALRTAATQADANPRDLYAMMDLGRHTGEILALLDERNRLLAAIDAALAAGNSSTI
ncbi:MAG: zinc ribbon domain-containing protein [Thermomicrobiales bacterium]